MSAVRAIPGAFALGVVAAGRAGEITFYLHNAFAEALAGRQRDDEILGRYARGLLAWPDEGLPWEAARERLRPALRSVLFGTEPGADRIARPVLPMLVSCAAIDGEESIAFVGQKDVARWGLSVEQVLDEAGKGFAPRAWEGIQPYDAVAGIWHCVARDSYESSRLLVPGFLASFAGRVRGRPVACVPQRDAFVVCGDGDPEALAEVTRIALGEFDAAARPLSPALYTVGERGEVVPFVGESKDTWLGHKVLSAFTYEGQRAAFSDVASAAPITVVERLDGAPCTLTFWPTDARGALLPDADLVAFGEGLAVAAADIARLFGGWLRRRDDWNPVRWEVLGSLPASAFGALSPLRVALAPG